ncbi:hypothetical protein BY996DRAFT_6914732 [Phakopsora pachyrhizi]|nr:hypothetical protein BY996DRAFT_6914732 [Phakopsora pachyrhizi]
MLFSNPHFLLLFFFYFQVKISLIEFYQKMDYNKEKSSSFATLFILARIGAAQRRWIYTLTTLFFVWRIAYVVSAWFLRNICGFSKFSCFMSFAVSGLSLRTEKCRCIPGHQKLKNQEERDR